MTIRGWRLWGAVVTGTVALCALCAGLAAAETPAISTDNVRSTSTLRIISLAPNLTEALFALGYGEQVVADSDYCRFPPEARDRPHVGGLYNPNVELILSLRPDLVFHLPHHKDLAARLEAAGLRTVMVPSETVADVMSGVRLLGRTIRAERRAEALARRVEGEIEAITARASRLPVRRIALIVDHEPASIRGLYAAGSGNYLDELLRRVGGVNILSDTATTYPKISGEVLLRDPPDVILDSKYAESTQAIGDWEPAMRRAWVSLFDGGAKKPRVEFITEPRVMIPGPSIGLALRVLARHVHGAAFDDTPPDSRAAACEAGRLPGAAGDDPNARPHDSSPATSSVFPASPGAGAVAP